MWTSTHTARWHTGKFFLIQDERAQIDGPFDTLSVMGWDDDTKRAVLRLLCHRPDDPTDPLAKKVLADGDARLEERIVALSAAYDSKAE